MKKKVKEPEGEQQQTAANYLAEAKTGAEKKAAKVRAKVDNKLPSKTQLVVNVDKAKFETKEIPMSKTKAKAAKKSPAKTVKVKVAKKATGERKSAIAEMKIKVLTKEHGAREGTKRAAWMKALISSKTVAEAQKKVDGLDASVVRFAEQAGIIKLAA